MKKSSSMRTISNSIVLLLFGMLFIPIVCLSEDFSTGELYADIDNDEKQESIQWRKFKTTDMGDYYQLRVFDDTGDLIWRGPREEEEDNPYIYSSLDTGVSLPELLFDIDGDGYTELIAPEPQSDVRTTYYRKLRWKDGYFKKLPSKPLMMKNPKNDYFTWETGQYSYGIWVSKFGEIVNGGLVKANITYYNKDGVWKGGVALLKFTSKGAIVHRWIKPLSHTSSREVPVAKKRIIGTVYGLNPHGDGFLSIRKKPNSTEIGRLYNGDKVEIFGKSRKWFKIRAIRSGKVGWSHSNWIMVD